jgi:hypothetical protein
MIHKAHRNRHKPSSRTTYSTVAILGAMLKIFLPLLLIAAVAAWFLTHSSPATGLVRVTTTIPGADIYLDGTMTGLQTDTTLPDIPVGRTIVTVRKSGLVSDPEMIVADVKDGQMAAASFTLLTERSAVHRDSIPPLRNVRQQIFSTGEPVRSIPPAEHHSGSHFVDYSTHPTALARPTQTFRASNDAQSVTSPGVGDSATADTGRIEGTEITVSSSPEGAQIVVNGLTTPRTTPYTFHGLEAGMYIFHLLKPGYVSNPDSVSVVISSSFQSELAAFELRPDARQPKPILTVSTSPPAAGIRINGQHVGVGKVSVDAAFGTQTVEFEDAPGYRAPEPVKVDLTTGNPHQDVTGTYEKIVGNAYLAVLPSEDLGTKFESGKLRVLVDNELLLDNTKERFDATLLGRILAGKRLVRIEYGDLADDMHVNLFDGQVSEINFRIESFFSKRHLRLREKEAVPLDKWEQKSRRLTVLSAS